MLCQTCLLSIHYYTTTQHKLCEQACLDQGLTYYCISQFLSYNHPFIQKFFELFVLLISGNINCVGSHILLLNYEGSRHHHIYHTVAHSINYIKRAFTTLLLWVLCELRQCHHLCLFPTDKRGIKRVPFCLKNKDKTDNIK